MVIDMMRHASETLPRIILFISVFVYIKNAFADFEDSFRIMKVSIICVTACSDQHLGTLNVEHFHT